MEIILTLDPDLEVIKKETQKLRKEIQLKNKEIDLLSEAMRHYQKMCHHPGQKTGYNERDGSWANPCPVCGESH
jgi:prefoldin subunit 5